MMSQRMLMGVPMRSFAAKVAEVKGPASGRKTGNPGWYN